MRGLLRGRNLWVLAAAFAVFFAVSARPQTAVAANPGTINFQGKVVNANGTNVTDGTYSFVFKLYSVSSGGVALWTETQSSVQVTSGVFQVALGSVTSLSTVDFNANPSLYLGITFNSDPNGEMSPRPQLQSVPFAFNSDKVGGLAVSQLVQLAPGSVQVDTSTTLPSIFINKNNASGTPNILELQKAGSDVFLVDNSGNVGIGVTSTTNPLAISRVQSNATLATISNTSATTGAAAGFATYNDATNGFGFFGVGGTAYTTIPVLQDRAGISTGANLSGIVLNTGSATQPILFAVNGTEVARFDTSGNLLFGAANTNTITGANNQSLTVQTAGTGQLNLATGSTGILGLAASVTTLQSTNTAVTLDLNNAATTTFTLKNSGSGVANFNLFGGSLQTGSTPTTRLDNAGNLLNIGTITASGLATLSASTTAVSLTGSPAAAATSALMQLGSALVGGNAVANGGTYFSINTPGSGAGSAADPLNVQVAGKSYLKIANDGSIHGQGFDIFDPTDQGGATTNIGNYSAGGNFGQAISANAFINNLESYSADFIFSLASATTNNRNIGDSTNWYFNNAGALNGQVTSQDISTRGGYLRMTTAGTSGRGGLIAEGATGGTLDLSLNAANLPIIQEKVRPSVARATDDYIWGMGDTATAPTANDTLPANGMFFWTNNSTGATGWQGVVRSGGATIGTAVTCPGVVTVNQFATGRIIVVNATTVRFMIDNDASDGINMLDCGTVTGTLPAADMALESYIIHTTNTASTFDMDYARFWQDDAPTDPANASATTQAEQMQANISTAQDDPTNQAEIPDASASDSGVTNDGAPTPSPTPADTSTADTSALTNDVTSQPEPSTTTDDGSFQLTDKNGKVLIDFAPDGSATVKGALNLASASISGGLTVGGDVNVAGLSTFQKLATFIGKTIFRQDVQFDGHLTVAADTAGYASLKSGESKVHIGFKNAYEDAPVVSANTVDGQFVQVAISNITKDGFDILVAQPVSQDTKFSWTAIAVKDAQTTVNPPVEPTP